MRRTSEAVWIGGAAPSNDGLDLGLHGIVHSSTLSMGSWIQAVIHWLRVRPRLQPARSRQRAV